MKEATTISIERIASVPAVVKASAQIRSSDAVTLADMRAAASIPSPPRGERERGAWFARRIRETGIDNVGSDDVGNVLARWPGASPDASPVVIAAHLDTIFPSGTALDVRDSDGRVLAPGIGDNARGLAVALALGRALVAGKASFARPLVFAATVGEEGEGDLYGVKHLFAKGNGIANAAAFIAIDGAGSRRIVVRSVGSRRFRITLRGPGGHSWSDRGTANPADALALAIARIHRIRLPAEPAWAVTVARLGGGTSVNSIPASAWLELDVRAESANLLDRIVERVQSIVREAAGEVSGLRRRGSAPLHTDIVTIGDRPAASIETDAPLVRLARAATRAIGQRPELVASSTDANVPMALGVPSIAIGGGGESGGTHTLDEWYTNDGGPDGIVRALLVIAGAAELL
jgi:acetylornithine deacetylase/succinyl-diaminopimelate desuccinylase-like protein